MKYKNGREVKVGDPFVHVDDKHKRIPNAPHSLISGVQKGTEFVPTIHENIAKNALHLEDYNKLQEAKKKA